MTPWEYPPRPEGTVQEQLRQLWEYLFRLAERQNAEQAGTRPEQPAGQP